MSDPEPLRRLREAGEKVAREASPTSSAVRRALERVRSKVGDDALQRYLDAVQRDEDGLEHGS